MEKTQRPRIIAENAVEQLDNFFKGDSWVTFNFSKRILSLKNLDAFKKVLGFSHHIAAEVAHMNAWRKFVCEKLLDNAGLDIKDDSLDDWPEVADWDGLRMDFETTHLKLLRAIESFPDDRWLDTVPQRRYNFIFMVNGILEHDYYHYGQIAALLAAIRKLED